MATYNKQFGKCHLNNAWIHLSILLIETTVPSSVEYKAVNYVQSNYRYTESIKIEWWECLSFSPTWI